MDKVALIENDGVETSHLRLMGLDDKGAIGKQLADRRLIGLAASPPIVTGRGMIVATDRGQIEAYDVATGKAANPLSLVATREATGGSRWSASSPRTAATFGSPTRSSRNTRSCRPTIGCPVEEIENNFAGSTFDHPLHRVRRHADQRSPAERSRRLRRRRDRHQTRSPDLGNRPRDASGRRTRRRRCNESPHRRHCRRLRVPIR